MEMSHEELQQTSKQCMWMFRRLGGICYPYPHFHRCKPGMGPDDCSSFLVFPAAADAGAANGSGGGKWANQPRGQRQGQRTYRGAICCKYGKYLRPGTFHIEQDDGIYDLLTGDLITDASELEFTGADTKEEQARRKFYHNQISGVNGNGNYKVEQLRQEKAEKKELLESLSRRGLISKGGKWDFLNLLDGPPATSSKRVVAAGPFTPAPSTTVTPAPAPATTTNTKATLTAKEQEKRAIATFNRFLKRGPLLSSPAQPQRTFQQLWDAYLKERAKMEKPVDIMEFLASVRVGNQLEWHPYPLSEEDFSACVQVALAAWRVVSSKSRPAHFTDHCIGCLQLMSTHPIRAETGEVLFPAHPVLLQYIQPLFRGGKGLEQRGFDRVNVATRVKLLRDTLVSSGERICLPVGHVQDVVKSE